MHDTIGFMTTCINGELKEQACPGNAECKDGACDKVCTEGTQSCFDGTVYKCINNAIVTESCNGNMCKDNACGECSESDNTCINDTEAAGTLTTCVNGLKTTQSCANKASCNASGTCGACNDLTEAVCENSTTGGSIVTTCQNGTLLKTKNPDVSCNAAGTGSGECEDGETKCAITGYSKITYEVCTNGTWVETKCNASCTLDGKCGECKDNFDYKCENNTQYTCSNGKWKTGKDCGSLGCSSTARMCRECIDGETLCNDRSPWFVYVSTCKDGSYMPMSYDQSSYKICNNGKCNADKTDCAPVE
jgi:hypothetical protein